MKQRTLLYVLILTMLFLFTSCADAHPVLTASQDGFLTGLWHGFIIPASFIISWFADVNIYSLHNNGFGYNLGFVIGSGSIFWVFKILRISIILALSFVVGVIEGARG